MLTSRTSQPQDTAIPLNGTVIGDQRVVVMAGPCAVEDRVQMPEAALALKEAGVKILSGGAFKPRTSPYSFRGPGHKGLEILAEVREEFGLAIVTEVWTTDRGSSSLESCPV
jgi:3-deoxy-D-arabino-heptulosonate 7-phosphate (DAHP) synthase